uniref:ferroxidase n=1 Tax=Cyprinus carpio TaxID=7962 RepID=A0A8C2JJY9_CYPCA
MKSVLLSALVTAVIALQQAECLKRTYYIAIREEDWNYAPSGTNLINNRSIEQDEHASVFLSRGETRIGSVYKKALYRQYTDGSYSKEIAKPAWLGFLGPIIRAEVGDVIEVHMKNFATRPYSLHPHGVFYERNSEGWIYIISLLVPLLVLLFPSSSPEKYEKHHQNTPSAITINGYVYGNLPELEVCVGRPVSWHLFGIGNEVDIHSAYFHGHTLVDRKHRTDVLSLFPATFVTATMIPRTEGKWLLSCQVNDHVQAGMQSFYDVSACGSSVSSAEAPGKERHFYIAAEEMVWDYAPSGMNYMTNKSLTEPDSDSISYFSRDGGKLGGKYLKARYISYTDSTFTTKTHIAGSDEHLGILGKILTFYANKIQHELFLLFSVIDENESWYLKENIKMFGSIDSDPANEEFKESNKKHAVNGYMYGNLPALDLCNGEHVMWHILGLGSEVDIHGVYFEGNTFQRDGMNRDTLSVFPHTSVTVIMTPDNNGQFELSCLTGEHYQAGMRQHYEVKSCSAVTPAAEHFTSTVQYFIAAEEVEWNYAPDRTWELEKYKTTMEYSPGEIYLEESMNRIGAKYKKVVFREYLDETFTGKKPRRPEEEHLEIMGPIIRAEVGERIQIVFKNKASKPYSVHAHGVKTSKSHQNGVQPGHTMTYSWFIPNRSGPGPSDPNCITYAYYSSVSLVEDLMSGLVGPLIVCRKNTLDTDRRRKDIDKEFALLLMVFNENESHYLDENIKTYLNTDPEKYEEKYDGDFMESNKMHGINGKMYANLHGLNMTENDKTEWYLIGLGNEVDMHTVHFHAQSFIYRTDHPHRADVYDLFPGTFQTIEMTAGSPGQWLLHCHVTDHIHAGMETLFTVHPRELISSVDRLHIALTLNDRLNQRFPNAFVRF